MAQSDQQVEKINSNMFKVVGVREKETEKLAEKSISFWKEVFLRFSQNKVAIIGLILTVIDSNYGDCCTFCFTIQLPRTIGTI